MAANLKPSRKPSILSSFLGIEAELKHYLLKMLVRKEDVEDILQDTYIRVSKAEKTTHIKSHRPFLFKVARNLALNQISQNKRRITFYVEDFEASEVIDSKSSVESREMARQELRKFYTMLRETLPAQCRKVFILRKVYGFSHKEIAQKLGISVSTVEKHIINGMRRCDHIMTRSGDNKLMTSNPTSSSGNITRYMEYRSG
ncbi:RNA polymerase sigma factor [bacterium SCSIO 12696]|nr:RNA polymerase sigma factor [bacterium SCSIO 12696]